MAVSSPFDGTTPDAAPHIPDVAAYARMSRMVSPNGTSPVLALDLGGTKFAAGVVAGDGTVVAADREPTPYGEGADAEALWRALCAVIDRVLATTGLSTVDSAGGAITGVGVGCGGPMDWPSGEVSPLNIPAWRRFPLRARLAARFPDVPVRLHNDAICAVIGEHWLGAGRGHDNMMGMVVSTGVGGGLILGGHAIDGATGNAGHVGHIVVVPGGQSCGCGGHGCVEAETRGPRVAEWAVRQPGAVGVVSMRWPLWIGPLSPTWAPGRIAGDGADHVARLVAEERDGRRGDQGDARDQ